MENFTKLKIFIMLAILSGMSITFPASYMHWEATQLLSNKVYASQPPVDNSTLYVGKLSWTPLKADPITASDLNSRELIFNVYNTLIFMKGDKYFEFIPCLALNVPGREEETIIDVTKTVESFDCNPSNPIGSHWNDSSVCIGWVDNHANKRLDAYDVLYMIEPDGSYRTWFVQSYSGPELPIIVTLLRQQWIFHLQMETIYFVDEAGSIVDAFNIMDVEYSLKRGLVQDPVNGPMWMFYRPLFDQSSSDPWDTGNPRDAYNLAHLIDNAIEVIALPPGADIIINLGIPFPEMAFKQILSNTWASIVSKEFSVSIGCWDGDLYSDVNPQNGYPDWWDNVRRRPSPYDANHRYVGTGPYTVSIIDTINRVVEMAKNPHYWGFNPSPNVPGGRLERIKLVYGASLEDFLNGDLDIWPQPISNPPPGIIVFPARYFSKPFLLDSLHYVFTVNPLSPLCPRLGSVAGPILPTFFNNTHVRKAFCYTIDRSEYITQAYNGNAILRNNFFIYYLCPDYYNPAIPGYYKSFEKAKEELQSAIFQGQNLWDAGFWVGIAYNTGNERRRLICEMIKEFFRELAIWGGWPENHFEIQIFEVDWSTYLEMWENFELPLWTIIYDVDITFSDADLFARPYMHSSSFIVFYQNYTAQNGWGTRKDEIIDIASKTQDNLRRAALYTELQGIYYNDAPSLPLAQPLLGGRSMWYWVRGWYFNVLYPADFYYAMLKMQTCWCDISGPIPGVPDGVTNARDITYLILHFGARPPVCGVQDPRWVGTYGYGAVDLYTDRVCNARDVTLAVLHFGHTTQP
ncbi:MAG: ABC transporter substrate-binding protein [Candidatus Bathyarchaeia archaeon]